MMEVRVEAEIGMEMRAGARTIVELVPNFYLLEINTYLYKEKRMGNRIVGGLVL
jgi:hypothetical protein